MKPDELLNQLNVIYGWDLLAGEGKIMIDIARRIGAGELIKKWTGFQEKFPGHSVKQFRTNFVEDKEIPFW